MFEFDVPAGYDTPLQAPLLAHLVTAILAQLQTLDDLPVDEVGAVLVFLAVVPRGEDLLAEEEPPGGVLLLLAPLLHLLLALGDGVHQVLPAAAQSPDLQGGGEVGGSAKTQDAGQVSVNQRHGEEVVLECHHLLIHGDVEGEAKGVAELDLLGQRLADFLGGGCRVHWQAEGSTVHKSHCHDDRPLGLGRLARRGRRSKKSLRSSRATSVRPAVHFNTYTNVLP